MTPPTLKDRVQLALGKARDQFPSEPKVVGMGGDLIVDSTGDDAVEVLVTIDESTPDDQWAPERLEPISKAIRESFRREGIDLWPYVHFLTPSDEEEAKRDAEDEKTALDVEYDGSR